MRLKSTATGYGGVAMAFHWITALGIVGLLVSGFRAAGMTDPDAKVELLRMHAAFGSTVLVLTLLRLGWWLFFDRKPEEPSGTPRYQARAARIVHGLLYLAIFMMAGSGIAMIVLSGAGAVLLSDGTGSLPDFTRYPPRAAHGAVALVLLALVAAHAAAALYHHFVLRDRVLARMTIGG